jgi:hypothetical protein
MVQIGTLGPHQSIQANVFTTYPPLGLGTTGLLLTRRDGIGRIHEMRSQTIGQFILWAITRWYVAPLVLPILLCALLLFLAFLGYVSIDRNGVVFWSRRLRPEKTNCDDATQQR